MSARASGSPAATQRSQNPDTMSVSGVPARPAWVSHSDNSAKEASFTPRLYSHSAQWWHLPTWPLTFQTASAFGTKQTCRSINWMSLYGVNPDFQCSDRVFPLLTRLGYRIESAKFD